jgi:hypothetical protein
VRRNSIGWLVGIPCKLMRSDRGDSSNSAALLQVADVDT